MSRPYGKFPRGGRKPAAAPQPVEIQVNMRERHTMEQLALEVQRALAMVEEYGAFGVEAFRFRLLPLDKDGQPVILRDEQGHAVTTINIPDEPMSPVYRENEPGVGVLSPPVTPQLKGQRAGRYVQRRAAFQSGATVLRVLRSYRHRRAGADSGSFPIAQAVCSLRTRSGCPTLRCWRFAREGPG